MEKKKIRVAFNRKRNTKDPVFKIDEQKYRSKYVKHLIKEFDNIDDLIRFIKKYKLPIMELDAEHDDYRILTIKLKKLLGSNKAVCDYYILGILPETF